MIEDRFHNSFRRILVIRIMNNFLPRTSPRFVVLMFAVVFRYRRLVAAFVLSFGLRPAPRHLICGILLGASTRLRYDVALRFGERLVPMHLCGILGVLGATGVFGFSRHLIFTFTTVTITFSNLFHPATFMVVPATATMTIFTFLFFLMTARHEDSIEREHAEI